MRVDADLCPIYCFTDTHPPTRKHSVFSPKGVNFTDESILMKPPAVHVFCVSLLFCSACCAISLRVLMVQL